MASRGTSGCRTQHSARPPPPPREYHQPNSESRWKTLCCTWMLTSTSRRDSTIDLQAGGDYFPPSENPGEGISDDQLKRARSTSTSQSSSFRRHNLSLSIPSLVPSSFANTSLNSPSSRTSSSAPFTDSFSSYANGSGHITQDYFQFDEASLPSGTEPTSTDCLPLGSSTYRLPTSASQPSSPVTSSYHHQSSGHHSYPFQPRQRGATFSGGSFGQNFEGFHSIGDGNHASYTLSPNQNLPIASAVPPHLTFTTLQSPASISPLTTSPGIPSNTPQSEQGYFVDSHGQIGQTELSLENNVQVQSNGTVRKLSIHESQQSQTQTLPPLQQSTSATEMSIELVDKLTLLDR